MSSLPIELKKDLTRRHATNVFIGSLLKGIVISIIIEIILYITFDVIFLPVPELCALLFAIYQYGAHLIEFTLDERTYNNEASIPLPNDTVEPEEKNTAGLTPFPQPSGRGYYNVGIALTSSQREYIAETLLETKTLPINYLESIGLSRPETERLRAELAKFKLIRFDNKNRVHLTKDGARTCQHILKRKKDW